MYRNSSRIALFGNQLEGRDGSREGHVQLNWLPSVRTRWESPPSDVEPVPEPCSVTLRSYVELLDPALTHLMCGTRDLQLHPGLL